MKVKNITEVEFEVKVMVEDGDVESDIILKAQSQDTPKGFGNLFGPNDSMTWKVGTGFIINDECIVTFSIRIEHNQ